MNAIEKYIAKRNNMLRELDVEAAREFSIKLNHPVSSDEVLLANLHKARVSWRDATDEEIQISQNWLRANYYPVPDRSKMTFLYKN